jgi:hypothetical protein
LFDDTDAPCARGKGNPPSVKGWRLTGMMSAFGLFGRAAAARGKRCGKQAPGSAVAPNIQTIADDHHQAYTGRSI